MGCSLAKCTLGFKGTPSDDLIGTRQHHPRMTNKGTHRKRKCVLGQLSQAKQDSSSNKIEVSRKMGSVSDKCDKDVLDRLFFNPTQIGPTKRKVKSSIESSKLASSSCNSNSIIMSADSETSIVTKSKHQSAQPVSISELVDENEEEVIQFTKTQQLCFSIINNNLVPKVSRIHHRHSKVLCLFIFGGQGSSMGEIAFDLVHHSSQKFGESLQLSNDEIQCPIYKIIDAASIIVANIDQRIHEYNRLKIEAIQARRTQLVMAPDLVTKVKSYDDSNSEACEDKKSIMDDNESASIASGSGSQTRDSPIYSGISVSTRKHDKMESISVSTTDTNLVTLNTKQRSILQLKLVKYFNSITSKWLIDLIQKEVMKHEQELINDPRHRVYLINLVPNQMTLFRSCLYLEQKIHLNDFMFPFWAIKFEGMKNSKLMKKDRSQQVIRRHQNGFSATVFRSLRLPHIFRSKRKISLSSSIKKAKSNSKNVETVTTKLNEKLSSKFNNHFIDQFIAMNRILRIQYNPVRCENYADPIEGGEVMEAGGLERPCSKLVTGSSDDFELLITSEDSVNGCQIGVQNQVMNESKFKTPGVRRQSQARISPMTLPVQRNSSVGLLSPSTVSGTTSSRANSMISFEFISDDSEIHYPEIDSGQGNLHRLKSDTSIKWAVQIHLFNLTRIKSRRDMNQNSITVSGHTNPAHLGGSTQPPTVIYYKDCREFSRSPIHFIGKFQRNKEIYWLTPVRIISRDLNYIDIFEAKQVLDRPIELRKQADLSSVLKRIKKAKQKLAKDSHDWLNDAIIKQHPCKSTQFRGPMSEKVGSLLDRSRPIRAVLTICLNINCIHNGKFRIPTEVQSEIKAERESIELRELIHINRLKDNAPNSILQPDYSSRDDRGTREAGRHVQFKLMGDHRTESKEHLKTEKRVWLDNHVFISSIVDEEACQSIEVIAMLLKQYEAKQQAGIINQREDDTIP